MIYGLDYETKSVAGGNGYALQPFRYRNGAVCTSVAVQGVHEDETYFSGLLGPDYFATPEQDALARKLIETNEIMCGWNLAFDLAWAFERMPDMYTVGLRGLHNRVLDVQVLCRILDNQEAPPKGYYGLKKAVERFIPEFAGYGQGIDFRVEDERLRHYNRLDAMLTARLAIRFLNEANDKQIKLARIVSNAAISFAYSNTKDGGIPISPERALVYMTTRDAEAAALLDEFGLTHEILKSPQKLKKHFLNNGHPVESTDKRFLARDDAPIVRDAITARGAIIASKKYGEGPIQCAEYIGEPKAYPSSRPFGTYTGRVTYTANQEDSVPYTLKNGETRFRKKKFPVGIAIQQWPRKADARDIICAPKGTLLIELDFQAQESRLLADISKDPTLLKIFHEGKDFHCYMGAAIVNSDYESFLAAYKAGDKAAKQARQLGKVANLSLGYRTGAARLRQVAYTDHGIDMSVEEAKHYHLLFRRLYPSVQWYWGNAIQTAKVNGFAESRGGRRIKLNFSDPKTEYSAEQTAINFPIQATGADMKFAAIDAVQLHLAEYGARYVMDLHDALFFLAPKARAEEFARKLMALIDGLDYTRLFGWTPAVALPVETKIGPSWGSLKGL